MPCFKPCSALARSDPEAEERETELKASAMLDAIVRPDVDDTAEAAAAAAERESASGDDAAVLDLPPRVLLIDHEDSFVHTLANYLRQTGAEVVTSRSGPAALGLLEPSVGAVSPFDLVVLSPGPGNPSDFGLSETLARVVALRLPCFGVCLGLQGMVEFFGGELGCLEYPMHGKPSPVALSDEYLAGGAKWPVFEGLPPAFEVARYHSLHALSHKLPPELRTTAVTADGVVMAVEHRTLPMAAVQFHPESILTNPSFGLGILSNCLNCLSYDKA